MPDHGAGPLDTLRTLNKARQRPGLRARAAQAVPCPAPQEPASPADALPPALGAPSSARAFLAAAFAPTASKFQGARAVPASAASYSSLHAPPPTAPLPRATPLTLLLLAPCAGAAAAGGWGHRPAGPGGVGGDCGRRPHQGQRPVQHHRVHQHGQRRAGRHVQGARCAGHGAHVCYLSVAGSGLHVRMAACAHSCMLCRPGAHTAAHQ